MKYRKEKLLIQFSTLVMLMALMGCTAKSDQAEIISRSLTGGEDQIETNSASEALVVFLAGEVYVTASTGDQELNIGDSVVVGERILTGSDGYVELQLGEFATLRINSDTEYVLDHMKLSDEQNQASGSLVSGTVISKVKKLIGNDAFEVGVSGAICAVRGTQFIVKADSQGNAYIGVNEGYVNIVPPALSTIGMDPEAVATIEGIASSLPIIGPGMSFAFNTEIFKELEATLVSLSEEELVKNSEMLKRKAATTTLSINIDKISEANANSIREFIAFTEEAGRLSEDEPTDWDKKESANSASKISNPSIDERVESAPGVSGVASSRLASSEQVSKPSMAERVASEAVVLGGSKSRLASPDTDERIITSDNAVVIRVKPEHAWIWVDYKKNSQGKTVLSGGLGDGYHLSVSAPGYITKQDTIIIRPGSSTVNIDLEPLQIVNRLHLTGYAVGTPYSNRKFVILATSDGSLVAIQQNGHSLWVRETANRNTPNIFPSIVGQSVFAIGDAEFTMINLQRGNVIKERPLVKNQQEKFGRRVVAMGNYAIIPGDQYLEIVNGLSGESLRKKIEIPGGSYATPAVWNNKILIANTAGELVLINSRNYSVEDKIKTGSLESTGQAPGIIGDMAFIAGKMGTVSAVNLRTGKTVWERSLAVQIETDFAISEDTVYAYGNGKVFALSVKTGQDMFPPMENMTTAPLVLGDHLYLGVPDDSLAVFDRRSSEEIGRIPLGIQPIGRPTLLGDYVVAIGGKTAVVVDAKSITHR